MTDYPILVSTSIGPIGGIVTEPDGERKAAAVIAAGVGGRRFGVNRLWTELAWDLADRGFVVLRVDYPGGQGDSSLADKNGAPIPFWEAVSWFRQRAGNLELVLMGSCYGARLAVSAATAEERMLGVGFITPTFVRWRTRNPKAETVESFTSKVHRKVKKKIGRVAPIKLDPRLEAAVAQVMERTTVWAMVGERDQRSRADISRIQAMLRREGRDALEVDEVPGLLLHTQPSLEGQQLTRERVAAWASQLLDQEVVSP